MQAILGKPLAFVFFSKLHLPERKNKEPLANLSQAHSVKPKKGTTSLNKVMAPNDILLYTHIVQLDFMKNGCDVMD